MSKTFERVIFDSPPILAVTDAAVIAPQVDGTIIVARSNQTAKEVLASTLKKLQDVQARVIGCILNDVMSRKQNAAYGYYDFRSTYGSDNYGYGNYSYPKRQNAAKEASPPSAS